MADVNGALTVRQSYTRSPVVAIPPVVPAGMIRAAVDFFVILVTQMAGGMFAMPAESPEKLLDFWALAAGVTALLILSHGGYQAARLATPMRGADVALRCFFATSLTMITVALMMGHAHVVTRHWTPLALCVTASLLVAVRSWAAIAPVADEAAPGPLVICHDAYPPGLSTTLAAQRMAAPAGVLCLGQAPAAGLPGPLLPDFAAVLEAVRQRKIRDIIFIYEPALEAVSAATREHLLSGLLAYPARLWLAVNTAPQLPGLFPRQPPYQLVQIATDRLISSINPMKRLFDLVFASLLLILVLPMLPLICLLVRLSGPGPVVFRQARVGAQGRPFTVLKFRTMRHVAGSPFMQAREDDPRVTRIGRFLRRTSVDELLQLVNVIRGDMSLVGPRPHAPETQVEGINFENAVKFYRIRHRVKPGMTGLAQIRGQRGETRVLQTLERRIASDLEYIENWSLWLDFLILLRTLPVLLRQTNAV